MLRYWSPESRTSTLTETSSDKHRTNSAVVAASSSVFMKSARFSPLLKPLLLQHGSKHLTGLFNGLYTCDFQTNFCTTARLHRPDVSDSSNFIQLKSNHPTSWFRVGTNKFTQLANQKTGKSHQNCWVSFSNTMLFFHALLSGKLVDPFPGWTQTESSCVCGFVVCQNQQIFESHHHHRLFCGVVVTPGRRVKLASLTFARAIIWANG